MWTLRSTQNASLAVWTTLFEQIGVILTHFKSSQNYGFFRKKLPKSTKNVDFFENFWNLSKIFENFRKFLIFLKIFENFEKNLKKIEFFLKFFENFQKMLPCIHLVLTLNCSNFFVREPILIILKLREGNLVKFPKKLW